MRATGLTWVFRLAAGAVFAALTGAPAMAEDLAPAAIVVATSMQSSSVIVSCSGSGSSCASNRPAPGDAGPVRITMGRAVDLVGTPVYARRTATDGTGLQVDFSKTPVFDYNGIAISVPHGLPLAASYISSSFGARVNPVTGIYGAHTGIDLPAPMGTPIRATADGVVSQAAWRGGYGLMVTLQHGGGVETRYAHMSRVAVSPGERIHAGDVLGYVGSTGRSTGPHVHYETRVNGRAVNPLG